MKSVLNRINYLETDHRLMDDKEENEILSRFEDLTHGSQNPSGKSEDLRTGEIELTFTELSSPV